MSKPLSVLASTILAYCRTRYFKEGQALALDRAFLHGFILNLNPRQQLELDTAFDELVGVGAFQRDGDQLFLTELGFNLLYPESA